MKRTILKMTTISVLIFVFGAVLPILPADAWGGYYTFRSTVAGSGIKQTGTNAYEIVSEKYDFSEGETVYALTRIFNVTNVGWFKFKHEIRGNNYYRVGESPVFSPNRNWWQEVYYWYDFKDLPSGEYDLTSSIQVDEDSYRQLKTVHLRVSGYNNCYGYNCGSGNDYNYNNNYNNGYFDDGRQSGYDYSYYGNNWSDNSWPGINNYQDRYQPRPQYNYNWTQTGLGTRNTGGYNYEIVNKRDTFNANDTVYALTKFSGITGIDRFRVKHEVIRNSGGVYKTIESAEMYPRYNSWDTSFISANFGKLQNGIYDIKVYISMNGGGYTYLNTVKIYVGRQRCQYHDNNGACTNYNYDWSRTNFNYRQTGRYSYDMPETKSSFRSNERMVIMTKLGRISDVGRFKIKHELLKNGYYINAIESDERRPNNSNWDYNYATSDFGYLSPGNYAVKVYISINGGVYKYLDIKNITVVESNYYNDYQNNNNFNNDRNYNSNYDRTRGGNMNNRPNRPIYSN